MKASCCVSEAIFHSQEAVRKDIAATHKQTRGKTNKKDQTMKTLTYTITVTAIALASLTGNATAIHYIKTQADAISALREECSYGENVHISKCVIKAVNVSEKETARVVYKTAELLPPPVEL